jgi:hypothetical protein
VLICTAFGIFERRIFQAKKLTRKNSIIITAMSLAKLLIA